LETGATHVPSIHFLGMLSGDAKWGAFYGAGAFILPSHQENFGIAVAEAMACGTPVLISNKVNIWREIVDGKAGFAGPDTEEGTLGLLQAWSQSAERGEALSAAAMACARERFSIESAATRLMAAIR